MSDTVFQSRLRHDAEANVCLAIFLRLKPLPSWSEAKPLVKYPIMG